VSLNLNILYNSFIVKSSSVYQHETQNKQLSQ